MTTELIEKSKRTDYFVELENLYGAHNYHPLDVVIERAEGVWVYDVEGKRYLDCLAAYSAVNQGTVIPKFWRLSSSRPAKVTLTSRAFRNEQLPLLYKELHDLNRLRPGAPHELRRRSRRNRDQDGPQVGLQDQGHPPRTKPRLSSAPIIFMAAPSPS